MKVLADFFKLNNAGKSLGDEAPQSASAATMAASWLPMGTLIVLASTFVGPAVMPGRCPAALV